MSGPVWSDAGCHCGDDCVMGGCCPDADCWWECRESTVAERVGDAWRDGDAA